MKKLILMAIALSLLVITTSSVLGATIRIDPALPAMVGTTADFEVSVTTQSDDPTTDPHIFLVMTDACHAGLTGDVTVEWGSTTIAITVWHEETEHTNGIKVPPGTTEGAAYTVASLMDHLGTLEPIWWAFESFLGGPITQTPQTFTVTLPSTHARMLVYAIGKSLCGHICEDPCGDPCPDLCCWLFNNKVPPTIPGFVVPELGPALLAAASFSALALYTVKRRKT